MMSDSIPYPRGSEWRRWDLHVHSPESSFLRDSQPDWGDFIDALEKAPEEVKAIAITDYGTIDGYKEVKKHKENGRLKNIDLILPNVELRIAALQASASSNIGIDIHFIFDNTQENHIEEIERCLRSLKYTTRDSTYCCEERDFIRLGRDLGECSSDEEALKNGFSNFRPSREVFVAWIESEVFLREHCLIVIDNNKISKANTYKGNTSNVNEILRIAHMIFSGDPNDREYYLGKKGTLPEGGIKPCVHGCDKHVPDKLFQVDKDRFCWIKADPTFEGLKQITYEPADRIRIQEPKPEGKEDYQVIDRVKFTHDKFCPKEILLNQNLTAIIGGKSTGKSVLLRNIAQTIDGKQVEKNLEDAQLLDYGKGMEISNFLVVWKDQHKDEKQSSVEAKRKIIYIPQSYLNRVADRATGKDAVKKIVEDILKQEDAIKGAFEQLERENRGKISEVSQWIVDLFDKKDALEKLSSYIRNIGDKKGIEVEVQKLKREISELNKKAGMTTEEMDNYNSLSEKISELDGKMRELSQDLHSLEMLAKHQANFSASTVTLDLLERLSQETRSSLSSALKTFLQEANDKWQAEISKKLDFLKQQKIDKETKKEGVEKELLPLRDKAKGSQSLAEKSQKLSEEEGKLEKIKAHEERLGSLKSDLENLVGNIAKAHSDFFENFSRAKAEILKQKKIIKGRGLKFDMDVLFKEESFQACINKVCNQNKLIPFGDTVQLKDYSWADIKKFKDDMKKITEGILKGTLAIKSEYDKKKAIQELNPDQSWFGFDYKIEKDGDEISAMSPGKRSFVLLQLLIELDNSKCPILLDQPEDDLDNRSIYKDLVEFIKTKKKERQIIIVTHNANLVVAADAECVIVANQEGEGAENKEYQFEFVQGALENTFYKDVEYVLEKCGIKEHVCDILEGGKDAFEERKKKYNF